MANQLIVIIGIAVLIVGFLVPTQRVLTVSITYNNQNSWNAQLVNDKLPYFQYSLTNLGIIGLSNTRLGNNLITIEITNSSTSNTFIGTYYIDTGNYTISTFHQVNTGDTITIFAQNSFPPSKVFVVD